MRTPAFHRRMTLLALFAMLLLFALPTVGRVLSGSSADSRGVWAQMCTMAGLKLVKIAPGDAHPLDPPTPKPSGMSGEDCAYCPVLAGLVLLLVWTLFVAPQATHRALPPWRRSPLRAFLHPSGLGSRGPPLAL
ncbi:DUF2946 family protein [Lysobacter sp. MMG2]|uniref:DUF2946 family protein n=1 Tax=Lysobacter sp. MMG2 TaxID=2801338 RepID=UPI001C21C1A5|nr:DUF2946 family protein [Lysobacter sp. MMG2]